jgi:O-antigen/teichoic acid export membrane protein
MRDAAEPAPVGWLARRVERWLELWWRVAPRGREELRTTLTVLAGSAVALLGSLVARVLMARALPPAELGLLLLAIALATPLGGVLSLGLGQAAALVVADRRAAGDLAGARRVAASALVLAASAGVAGWAALWLGSGPLARGFAEGEAARSLQTLLRAVSPIVVMLPLGLAMLGVHRGFGGATARAVLRDGGGGVARTLGVALAGLAGGGGTAIALGFAIGVVVSDGVYVAYGLLRGWVGRLRRVLDRELLARVRGLAPLHGLSELGRWSDVLAVGLVLDPRQVGLYGLARGFGRMLEAVQQAPAHSFLPTAATLDDEALRPVHGRVRELTLALLWAPATVCLLSPEWIVVPFAGGAYRDAAPLLAWLALAVLLDVVWGFNHLVLLARRGERAVLVVSVATIAATVALVLALAPRWGAVGAAAGLAAAGGARVAALGLLLRRRGYRQPGAGRLALPALLALGGVSALRWSVETDPRPAAAVTIAVAILGASVLGRAVLRSPAPRRTPRDGSSPPGGR